MRWPTLALTSVLVVALGGCSRESGEGEVGETPETPTAEAPAPPAQTQPAATPPRQSAAPAAARTMAVDEPWTPVDTGTVSPGMSRDDVVAVWGKPAAERRADGREYLYFRNGCEVSCGTFDVVFLEGNQVVDAIVRGRGHTYAGTSSSPPGREGTPTLPGRAGG